MELTEKTLKDFWIWYLLPEQRKTYKTNSLRGVNNVAKIRFLAMSFTERYGVYVDFFDSVGLTIELYFVMINEWCVLIDHVTDDIHFTIDENKSRPGARTQAIEKANEIYNLNQ